MPLPCPMRPNFWFWRGVSAELLLPLIRSISAVSCSILRVVRLSVDKASAIAKRERTSVFI